MSTTKRVDEFSPQTLRWSVVTSYDGNSNTLFHTLQLNLFRMKFERIEKLTSFAEKGFLT